MKIDASISQRIAMLRTLLILMVVILHVCTTPSVASVDFSDIGTVLDCIFVDQFGRFAVPALSAISAYLLFGSGLDLVPRKLYTKKFKTLVVPFLFFNVIFLGARYLIATATGWETLYSMGDKSHEYVVNAFTGYNGYPINVPLHFLRDLFVLALMAPLFGWFLRNRPWLGLVIVCTIFLNDLDGCLVNRNTMAVLFYIGGMAAIGKWDLRRYDRHAIPAALVLVALCAAPVFLRIESHDIVYLASPPLVWIASARVVGTRIGRWAIAHSKYSFFVFLAHWPVLHVVDTALAKLHLDMPLLVRIGGTTVLVTAFLVCVYEAAMALVPDAFNAIIGARARQPAAVDRRRAPRPANAPVYTEAMRLTLLNGMEDKSALSSL